MSFLLPKHKRTETPEKNKNKEKGKKDKSFGRLCEKRPKKVRFIPGIPLNTSSPKQLAEMENGSLTPPPSQENINENINISNKKEPIVSDEVIPLESQETSAGQPLLTQQPEPMPQHDTLQNADDANIRDQSGAPESAVSLPHPSDVSCDTTVQSKHTEECSICKDAATITISCGDCKNKVCFPCTELKETQFVIYKCSKRKYSCDKCGIKLIAENPCYTDMRLAIRALTTNNEASRPERSSAKSNTKLTEATIDIAASPSTPQITTPTTNLSRALTEAQDTTPRGDKPKNEIICKYYKKGACMGANGIKRCPYAHPRACRFHLQFGPGGCRNGRNCKFMHPKICRYSLEAHLCYNLECKFYHLKGTKRYEETEPDRYHNKRESRPIHYQENRHPSPPHTKNYREVPQEETRIESLEKNFQDLQKTLTEMVQTMQSTEGYRRHFPPLPPHRPMPTYMAPYHSHVGMP